MKKFLFGILGLLFAVPAVAATLPAGYTELEYIQGDKSAYLKSGIILDNDSGVEAKFQFPNTESASSGNFICGARNSGPTRAFALVGFSGGLYWASNYNNSGETFGHADTNIHIIKRDKEKVYFDGSLVLTSASATFTTPGEAYVFSINQGGTPFLTSNIKLWYLKMWDNGTLVRDFVPAKRNSDNVVGMYDTVNNVFYQNSGTGTFTAGPEVLNPCRNLFDMQIEQGNIGNDGANTSSSARVRTAGYISVSPNTTYTLSVDIDDYTGSSSGGVFLRFYNASSGDFAEHYLTGDGWHDPRGGYTFTTPAGAYGLRIIFAKSGTYTTTTPSQISNIQLEEGSTATAYVPYCANAIKIATTAYNSARFSPVVNDLNDTIATIRDVVTNTINQTKAIADLQATKQTRPDENCPAGKKCLLVETEENGVIVPHWYEIVESPEVQ